MLRETTGVKEAKETGKDLTVERKRSQEQRPLINTALEADTTTRMPQLPIQLQKPCVEMSRDKRGQRKAKLR